MPDFYCFTNEKTLEMWKIYQNLATHCSLHWNVTSLAPQSSKLLKRWELWAQRLSQTIITISAEKAKSSKKCHPTNCEQYFSSNSSVSLNERTIFSVCYFLIWCDAQHVSIQEPLRSSSLSTFTVPIVVSIAVCASTLTPFFILLIRLCCFFSR